MELPTQILALLNPGNPSTGGGFIDAVKGPLLILVIALGLALLIAIVILRRRRMEMKMTWNIIICIGMKIS